MTQADRQSQTDAIAKDWAQNPRWKGITRTYTPADVVRLRGSVPVEHSLARRGAEKLWQLLHENDYINCLGALTGGQAVQQVKAGVRAIYLSGWQVASDNNTSGTMYPDQSLYPVDSVPEVVRRINNAFRRADQIQWAKGEDAIDFFAPIVADAEAGFGGVLNAYELMQAMIGAGAAGVHYEDQLASAKKCGHMGGKVLVPTQEAIQKLVAARLAADVAGVPTLLLARTDANAATLLTSDVDEYDAPFVTGERTAEGFYVVKAGLDQAISRALAYAPYADLLWCETAKPDLDEARRFAEAVHAQFPEQDAGVQLLALVQLGGQPQRGRHRPLPARAGGHGLPLPVHHPGRGARHVARHVRPGAQVCGRRHARLCRAAAARVWRRRARLHLCQPPAGGGRRLLRRPDSGDPGGGILGHGAVRLHRGRAVLDGCGASRLRCRGGRGRGLPAAARSARIAPLAAALFAAAGGFSGETAR